MVKSLNDLRQKMKPEVSSAAKLKAVEIITEMSLAETRKARGVNQAELAKRLAISQPNISQIESRPDMLISTLEHYINALGGKLELHAKFPDGQDVEITRMFKL